METPIRAYDWPAWEGLREAVEVIRSPGWRANERRGVWWSGVVKRVVLAADRMTLGGRAPPVSSQPSARSRAAVTGEYGPPGTDAAFSRPRSRSKKASHKNV